MAKRLSFIDIRDDIKSMRDHNISFGWVALRSADLTKSCVRCSSTHYKDSAGCIGCFGSGRKYTDKLIRAKKSLNISGIDYKTEVGIINTTTQVYYIEHASKPKTTDYILELDVDSDTGKPSQPFAIRKVFKINDSHPYRDTDGRIEYWKCLTEEKNFDLGQSVLNSRSTSNVAPVHLPALSRLDSWYVQINSGSLYLNGAKNSFSVTTLAGDSAELKLSPHTSPPIGKLKYKNINGDVSNVTISKVS